MTDPSPAAGGLSDAEVEFVYDWAPDDPGKRREMAEELSHIIAARTEAADREAARVTAAVEALAGKWDLRAALSSAGTTALDDLLDRERAKAAGEAVLEALRDLEGTTISRDDPDGFSGTFMQALHGGDTGRDEDWREAWEWSRKFTDRAAAVSPEGGDA